MKKKNVLYLSEKKSYQQRRGVGICNKIDAQIKQFENAGCEVMSKGPTGNGMTQIFNQRLSTLKWSGVNNIEKFDVVYIRFDSANGDFIRLLKRYKKKNPDGKIILEIPTYPFRKTYMRLHGWLYYLQVQFYLLLASCYIDRFALVANSRKKIYAIPVLAINNGVDYETIRVRNPILGVEGIHIICVADYAMWHGCDRLISGLHTYIQKGQGTNVVFHIVGGGKELDRYKKLVRRYGIEKNVLFHGILTGKKLDEVYDMCDLAAECFGCHRVNVWMSSSLKSREYGAKGLPMLTSVQLDMCNKETRKYICNFPADEQPIDVEKIVRFYHSIYRGKDKTQVCREIRDTFQKYGSMENGFKNVINYVVENE